MTMSNGNVSRRSFVQGMLAALAGANIPSLSAASTFNNDPLVSLVHELAAHQPVVKIGTEYLRSSNPRMDAQALDTELRARIAASLKSDSHHRPLIETVDRIIRSDFEQDRIAEVDHWWLSETEALLCALAALHA